YAMYGLGDRGALDASRTAVVSFSRALAQGDGGVWTRGAWLDVVNPNFVRRLHHHAMTALEQGVFLVDRDGIIRYVSIVGPIDPGAGWRSADRAGARALQRAGAADMTLAERLTRLGELLVAMSGSPVPTHLFQTLADEAGGALPNDYVAVCLADAEQGGYL